MNKCICCGGNLSSILTIHKEYESGLTIAVNNTPVDICENCLEEYLNADVMDKLNKILDSVIENKSKYNNNIAFVDYNNYK